MYLCFRLVRRSQFSTGHETVKKIRERKKASPAFFEKHEKLHLLRKDGCRIARLSFEMAEIYYHEHRIKHFNLPIDVLYYILALYSLSFGVGRTNGIQP